jgi:hypothetical protein
MTNENNTNVNSGSLDHLNDLVSKKFGPDCRFSETFKQGNLTQIKREIKKLMFSSNRSTDPDLKVIGQLAYDCFEFLDGLP